MARPVVQDLSTIVAQLIADAKVTYLAATTEVWDARVTDPISLILNVIAGQIRSMQVENLTAYLGSLPGPESTELTTWAGLFGLRRESGELNSALWERLLRFVDNPISGSRPAFENLALSVENVRDAHFVRQADLSFNVYLSSEEAPIGNALPGTAADSLKTTVETLINLLKNKHIDDTLKVLDATVVGCTLIATVRHSAFDIAALQIRADILLTNYVRNLRRFNINPDVTTLSEVLISDPEIHYLEAYGFKIGSGSLTDRLADIPNGFYSCIEIIHNDEQAEVVGEINLTWTRV